MARKSKVSFESFIAKTHKDGWEHETAEVIWDIWFPNSSDVGMPDRNSFDSVLQGFYFERMLHQSRLDSVQEEIEAIERFGSEEKWKQWKTENNALIRSLQRGDGSVDATYGKAYGTSMALLSLALEYRFLPIYER